MLDKILAGGWLMLPLMLCSVAALAIIIERAWTLRLSKLAPEGFMNEIMAIQGRFTRERLEALKKASVEGAIFAPVLALNEPNTHRIKFRLESDAKSILQSLEKSLPALGTIATIAPLLGLLGTVTGMIDIFEALGQTGPAQAPGLASGIGKALLTTALGLIVAIPTIVFHRYFHHQLEALDLKIERDIERYCFWHQKFMEEQRSKS